jgi:hypothetical protein
MPRQSPFAATQDITSLSVPRLHDRLFGDFASTQFQDGDAKCLCAIGVCTSLSEGKPLAFRIFISTLRVNASPLRAALSKNP